MCSAGRPASVAARAATPRQRGRASTNRFESSRPTAAARDLLGAEHPRRRPDDRGVRLVRSLAGHLGVGPVGADHVHRDRHAGRQELALQRAREAEHRVLGRRVDGQAGHRRQGRHRAEVDHVHVLAAALLHGVYGRARPPDHPEQVDLDLEAHLVVRVLPGLARAQHARVVDPDLERPALQRRARRAAMRLGVAHVELLREAADRTARSPPLPRRRCRSRARCTSAPRAAGRSRGRSRGRRR